MMIRLGVTLEDDLGKRRDELATAAARQLAKAHMIVYEEQNRIFRSTDLGRIAAKYYIRCSSIEIFNATFKQAMSEADVLAMLSMSTEVSPSRLHDSTHNKSSQFAQIQVRENEIKELEQLMSDVPCQVKVGLQFSRP
jgi:antiviral helicase SLH1